MLTTTGKAQCSICSKDKVAYECKGCLKDFCYIHLKEHRQLLSKQLDEIENDRNLLQQTLIEQNEHPKNHSLIQQIDQWEKDSIEKIHETAKNCREILFEYTKNFLSETDNRLIKLTDRLIEIRQENEFNESDLNEVKTKLIQLTEDFTKPSEVLIRQDSSSFIKEISVIVPSELDSFTMINLNTKWMQHGITIAGGNGYGNRLNQLFLPQGIYLDDDQTIYIADWNNHRIVSWRCNAKSGQIIAGGNGQGNRINQLNCPTNVIVDRQNDSFIICDSGNRRVIQWPCRNNTSGPVIISDVYSLGVTMDNNGYLYFSDTEKHEVRRWKRGDDCETIVAGGNGQGDHLNQLNGPSSVFVDKDYSVYVSDEYNCRVMKWIKGAKEGIVVAGGQGQGDGLSQLSYPRGVIVDHLGQIYVADSENNRVMRWCKEALEGSIVVGGNGEGQQSNQFYCPRSLSFDREGNLYVGDYRNYRIQKFQIDLS